MPINRSNLSNYALFKEYWTGQHPGLSHQGLDEVTLEGANRLAEFAKTHNVDGTESAPGAGAIEPEEREVMEAILSDAFYGRLFEQDARPVVLGEFRIDPGAAHLPTMPAKPVMAQKIVLPGRVTRYSPSELGNIESLPKQMAKEYEENAGFFDDPNVTNTEKSKRALALLRDFSQALWARGEQGRTEHVGNALLDEYARFKFGKMYGTTDFSGTGFSAAQSLVLGLDPFDFRHNYPNAKSEAAHTHLSMDGAMAGPMKFVDQYRKALGKSTGAEEFEKKSALGFLIGEESGHTKHGALDEMRPFSTSGLNWGLLLFPNDAEVAKLPPKENFEFPIDCLDRFSGFVHAYPGANGDYLAVRDSKGKAVSVEKVIQRDAQGKPVSWSAVFKNAQGQEVPASDVLGVITDPSGRAKGDGEASKSADMWWWGFCDRNTAQALYKQRFQIPQLDRDVIKVKAGSGTITVPRDDAQKLIDLDIPSIATNGSFSGFRFDDEPQQISLKDGQTFHGRVRDVVLAYGPGVSRTSGDQVAVHDAPGRPLLGALQIDRMASELASELIDVKNIESISRKAGTRGAVSLVLKGDSKVHTVTVKDRLPWTNATRVGDQEVLKQDASMPIRGLLSVDLADGTSRRIAPQDIAQITGEMQTDMRISQFIAYVAKNEGMYATDAVKAAMVSNGMRRVNRLELDEKKDGTRPVWAPQDGALEGLHGNLDYKPGDKVIYARGLFSPVGSAASSDYPEFSGWYQVRGGRIVNEGFISGEPDFAWGDDGPLNWLAPSNFNEFVDAELRVGLMVNGVKDLDDAKAKKLNLPANWKSYQVPQGP